MNKWNIVGPDLKVRSDPERKNTAFYGGSNKCFNVFLVDGEVRFELCDRNYLIGKADVVKREVRVERMVEVPNSKSLNILSVAKLCNW